jgi:hypothetical protein
MWYVFHHESLLEEEKRKRFVELTSVGVLSHQKRGRALAIWDGKGVAMFYVP